MKWMSSLATWLETVIDSICWQNLWRSEHPYKISFQPATQCKLSWWSSLWTASCSSQSPRTSGTVRRRTCRPAFERDEEQIWPSLADTQNHHNHIHIHHAQLEGMKTTQNQNQSNSPQQTLHKQCPNQEAPTLWRSAPSCVEPRPHVSLKLSWTWLTGICTRSAHPSSVGSEYVFCRRTKKNHPEKSTYSTDLATISSY